jgi:hypothetical protein
MAASGTGAVRLLDRLPDRAAGTWVRSGERLGRAAVSTRTELVPVHATDHLAAMAVQRTSRHAAGSTRQVRTSSTSAPTSPSTS